MVRNWRACVQITQNYNPSECKFSQKRQNYSWIKTFLLIKGRRWWLSSNRKKERKNHFPSLFIYTFSMFPNRRKLLVRNEFFFFCLISLDGFHQLDRNMLYKSHLGWLCLLFSSGWISVWFGLLSILSESPQLSFDLYIIQTPNVMQNIS